MRVAVIVLLSCVFVTLTSSLGLYLDDVDHLDAFVKGTKQYRNVVMGRHFAQGKLESFAMVKPSAQGEYSRVVSGGNRISTLDQGGSLVEEQFFDEVFMYTEGGGGSNCFDWNSDGVCDAFVASRRGIDVEFVIWSGVEGRQLFIKKMIGTSVSFVPSSRTACVTTESRVECWLVSEEKNGGITVTAEHHSISSSSGAASPNTAPALIELGGATYVWYRGNNSVVGSGLLTFFWDLREGSVVGYRVEEGIAHPIWKFGRNIAMCAMDAPDGQTHVWSPATDRGNGKIARKFLDQRTLFCASDTCSGYFLDARTGSWHASVRIPNCTAPNAVAFFENRFVLVFRSSALFSTLIMTGSLYYEDSSNTVVAPLKGFPAVRALSSVRSLEALPFAIHAGSLTILRSKRGLVSPCLVFSTHDNRVVAFPFHASAPHFILSHRRRFGGPIKSMRSEPQHRESQIVLSVLSEIGDVWNVTVSPDGSFDEFSAHDSKKKWTLLAVMAAGAIAVAFTSYYRKRLPLQQRWYQ